MIDKMKRQIGFILADLGFRSYRMYSSKWIVYTFYVAPFGLFKLPVFFYRTEFTPYQFNKIIV